MINSIAVKLEHLNKFYGNFHACKDINLTIKKGDVFAFIGPNGAGKTTTIRMMTGIIKPNSGNVYINDIDIDKEPIKAKSIIGYVPDRPFLYEKLTGMEFLDMIREIYNVPLNTFTRLFEEYVELFEIKDWMDELIENYSHGMKQKLILISAFSHDPDIYIMDEPLVGLDPKSANTLKRLIKKLSEEGKTFFISTHILSLVEEICRNLAIINRGSIVLNCSLDEIKTIYHSDAQLEELFLKVTEVATIL